MQSPKRRRVIPERNPNEPFSKLPIGLVLVILREWFLLDIPVDLFHRELHSGPCLVPHDIGDVYGSVIDEDEPLISEDSTMDQSDYFGHFLKDRTKTVFQIFSSFCLIVRYDVAHAEWPDEWYKHFESGIHLYLPLNVRFLDLSQTEDMGNPRIYLPVQKLIPLLHGLKGLIVSQYAAYQHREHPKTGYLLELIPFPKTLRRLVIPFYDCSLDCLSLELPSPEVYLTILLCFLPTP